MNNVIRYEECVPDAAQGRRLDLSQTYDNSLHSDKMQNDCALLYLYEILNAPWLGIWQDYKELAL